MPGAPGTPGSAAVVKVESAAARIKWEPDAKTLGLVKRKRSFRVACETFPYFEADSAALAGQLASQQPREAFHPRSPHRMLSPATDSGLRSDWLIPSFLRTRSQRLLPFRPLPPLFRFARAQRLNGTLTSTPRPASRPTRRSGTRGGRCRSLSSRSSFGRRSRDSTAPRRPRRETTATAPRQ